VKLRIKRDPFFQVFQVAAAVSPQRTTKPILQNIKMECLGGMTRLMATDTEISITADVPDAEIIAEGQAVLPVGRLGMILRETNDEYLEIVTEDTTTRVEGRHVHFELAAQDPDEFPAVSAFDPADYFEVSTSVLRELVRRTVFAADPNSTRYALGGVLLEADGNTLVAVCTDGRRLAKMQGAMKSVGRPALASPTIVPAKAMQVVGNALPAAESSVKLAPRQNDLMISFAGATLYTRLLEGRYPRWRDVLPDRPESSKISLPAGLLLSAVRQASIMSSDESRGIDFTFDSGSVVLTNQTAEVGQSRIELPIAYDGPPLVITLDHSFMQEYLRVLAPDTTFMFDVADSDQAACCLTEDGYAYVIMPVSREHRPAPSQREPAAMAR